VVARADDAERGDMLSAKRLSSEVESIVSESTMVEIWSCFSED